MILCNDYKINVNNFFNSQLKEDSEGTLKGMLDHSRMALCMFMVSVLVFNPFGFVMDRMSNNNFSYDEGFQTPAGGRTILNFGGKITRSFIIN